MFWAAAIFTQNWQQAALKGSIRIWLIFLLVFGFDFLLLTSYIYSVFSYPRFNRK